MVLLERKKEANRDFEKDLANYAQSSDTATDSILTISNTSQTETVNRDQNTVLPTQQEIAAVNAKLPTLVADGTMFTKVQYDAKTKVETFYYDFTRDVDESLITKDNINRLKRNMVDAIKDTDSEYRLRAGVTFLYIYRSIDKVRYCPN